MTAAKKSASEITIHAQFVAIAPSDPAALNPDSLEPIAPDEIELSEADRLRALDQEMVEMWLYGRSPATIKTYRPIATKFLASIDRPMKEITLADVQAWGKAQKHLAPATQARLVYTIRSLFLFAFKAGYLVFNVTMPIKPPKIKDTLAERILEEVEVIRLIDGIKDPRNHLLVRLMFVSGCRVSEVAALRWRDCKKSGDAGQITVFGKGGKTRAIHLPTKAWRSLQSFKPATVEPDDPVFASRQKSTDNSVCLTTRQIQRIVKAAAIKVGLSEEVSPHFMRHTHATVAIQRGCPQHLLQQTLGHSNLATTGRYLHVNPSESSSKYLPI